MAPRLLIFDFDGTLADSWPWFLGTLDGTAARFGLRPVTPEQVEALRRQDSHAVMRALGVPLWKVPRIAAHLKREATTAPAPPLFPGIPALLRRLTAQGVVISVASSNTEAQIRRTLGPELCSLIRHVAPEASLFGKAARFARILRATGIPASEAMAIGDEARDIEAARGAGVAAGAVSWGFACPSLLSARAPDALFETPDAIARYCAA